MQRHKAVARQESRRQPNRKMMSTVLRVYAYIGADIWQFLLDFTPVWNLAMARVRLNRHWGLMQRRPFPIEQIMEDPLQQRATETEGS